MPVKSGFLATSLLLTLRPTTGAELNLFQPERLPAIQPEGEADEARRDSRQQPPAVLTPQRVASFRRKTSRWHPCGVQVRETG